VRSLVKALSWRVIATGVTVLLVHRVTGRWDLASAVGGAEVVLKTLLYVLHEHFWGDD
jgi:uncharacterized membrane protein